MNNKRTINTFNTFTERFSGEEKSILHTYINTALQLLMHDRMNARGDCVCSKHLYHK